VRLRLAIGGLALVGTGVSAYLTATHYAHATPICTGGGCAIVQRSEWATLGTVPVAALGLLGFLAVLASAVLGHRLVVLAGYGVSVAAAIFAVYLVGVQIRELHAVCVWCVVSDAIWLPLAVLTAMRVLRNNDRLWTRASWPHSSPSSSSAASRRPRRA
jgi:uncharacterized membrane protein